MRATALMLAGLAGAAVMYGGLRWSGGNDHAPASSSASAPAPSTETPVAAVGGGVVYISPARQHLIGVRTGVVTTRDLTAGIRGTGTLAYDETRITQIHTKISGWIEQTFVDFIGKPVQKGQPLFTIYSPDLVATENEYLLARNAQHRLGASQFEETRRGASSLLSATRRRLELWDLSAADIAEIERTGEPRKTVTVFAPTAGVVLERNAFAGQYITPEQAAFKLVDLSTIWAVGQIVESDLMRVRVGAAVDIELTNTAGAAPATGRISFIYPDVDPVTRRGRFRVDIPNPHLVLKPYMFVTMTVRGASSRTLAVPAEGVIDTGTKQYVILARGNGYFEPRVIRVGPPVDAFYPVISGLAEGDTIVTSAQFLIDSETNLQAAMQAMSAMPDMPDMPGRQPAAAPAARAPGTVLDVRTDFAATRLGDNTIAIRIAEATGEPVTDAVVTATFSMPAMPSMGMPGMRLPATLTHRAGGMYEGVVRVPMRGRWDVTVAVARAGVQLASRQLAVVVK